MEFDIENFEFLNLFYEQMNEFVNCSYDEIINFFSTNEICKLEWGEKEKAVFLILNKYFFQNVAAFFELINLGLCFPAFNALRSAIENMRLTRAFFLNEEFRLKYTNNKNIDFRNEPDYNFVQKKVNEILDKDEKTTRSQDLIPVCISLYNHHLTKGSMISEIHSELSKWSHSLNSNLLLSTSLYNNRISMNLYNELTIPIQMYIKKYLEFIYILINHHLEIFINFSFSKKFRNYKNEMIKQYDKYIELFYKN